MEEPLLQSTSTPPTGTSTHSHFLDQETHPCSLSKPNSEDQDVSFCESDSSMNISSHRCRWIDSKEVKKQCLLAGPMIFVNLLQSSLQLISIMFVGRLGELELASASIASSLAGVTGSSLLGGMACALDTLCGQAYGAKQYRLLGIYLWRAVVALSLAGIPLAFFWAHIDKIMVALGQDAEISKMAGEFALWLIPTLFAYACQQPLFKFLQAQSLVFPLLVCSSITLCCHMPICWLMVYKSGLGTRGAALTTSISNWINVVMLVIYVRFSRSCKKTRTTLSWEALHEFSGFFKLALPSAGMICLEWWSYETLIILSGLLRNPQLETSMLSICLTTASFAFTIPSGLGSAASTRISNELGAGHPHEAHTAVRVATALGFMESLIISTTLLSIRNIWGRAFSNEEEVIRYEADMTPWLAACALLDGIQGVLSGVARGCGWQKAGAVINLVSYYIVGLPAGFFLGFVLHFQGKGLWMGIIYGSCFQLVALIAITLATNWEKEAEKAANRVQQSMSFIQSFLPSKAIEDGQCIHNESQDV